MKQIVIVGGGAGGLELATRLGNSLGRKGQARIILVDKNRTHIWKPKLHEIAAGSMDLSQHEVDYMAQAHWHHFEYRIGEMTGLDRAQQVIFLNPFLDDAGHEIMGARKLRYDILVLAVGSLTNDFGTPGVAQYALRLESPIDAERFHTRMLNDCIRAQAQKTPLKAGQLHVAIIGAGATGVELAAELYRTTREVVAYGLDRVDPNKDLKVNVIEAADRILPALPVRLSQATEVLLKDLGVDVYVNSKVAAVLPDGVQLENGQILPAELVVWAAGVKAPEFLKEIGGLETNRINQLLVLPTLQTTRDPHIFAMGDCAACPWPQAPGGQGGLVPPRAQAAHQQANHLFQQIQRYLAGKEL
ncbi:MAG: NAD(P)/FAD-dependent oxidoreductase, partial [Burkholderiaceae bacterium]|nr:NAD(P)/FAD-dependent oxidoreductase [Burkholderiaceae bacterium]